MTATTIIATNHHDQLGEIYPTMLNELNCTFDVSFSRFHCCGLDGHALWPAWFVAVMVVAVMVCGRLGIGPQQWCSVSSTVFYYYCYFQVLFNLQIFP